MNTEITKPQMIIEERSGLKLSLDKENVEIFMQECEKKKFVCVGGEWINTADIKGVFYPETISLRDKMKRGIKYCNGDGKHPKVELQQGQRCGYCSHF